MSVRGATVPHGIDTGFPAGTVLPGGEPKLTIRIIKRCNFRCPCCGTFSGPDQDHQLLPGAVKVIVANLLEARFRGVINISGGEPTLHPDLEAIVTAVATGLADNKLILFTNGSWIGLTGWELRLKRLFSFANLLIRVSLDDEHVTGEARASGKDHRETQLLHASRTLAFLSLCRELGAVPAQQYDFAFKGTTDEAEHYYATAGLGDVPIYPIEFQKSPRKRPRKPGYFAIDLDSDGRPAVYLTLGHLADGERFGGLETIGAALAYNRTRLGALASCSPLQSK